MSNERHAERSNRSPTDFDRRALLRAFGVGGGLAAMGGVAAGDATEYPDADAGGAGVDGTFGFPATSPDVEPPVEADHTVELRIEPREGSEIPQFFFQPTGLSVEAGDTVKFDFVSPHHTVTAFHPAFGYASRVPEGVPPFSSPVLPAGGYWLYTFETEGVYDYHCGPHESFGHVGRIVVGSTEGFEPLPDLCAGEGGSGEEGPRLPFLTGYTVLRDPALDPENIAETGSVGWEEIAPESKRLFVEITGFPPCGDGC